MMYFNANAAGLKVRANTSYYDGGFIGEAVIQNGNDGFTVDAGTVVTLTGWYFFIQDYTCYYIVEYPGYYINIESWSVTGTIQAKTQAQAQSLINELLKNNQYIFENNLLLARYANRLNLSEKNTLYGLQKRLEQRDNMLRESDVFSEMQEARIIGYSNYESYLNQFMRSHKQGVGIAATTLMAIIVGVAVVSSLATAAYYAFKAAYEESKQDVELSRKMLQIFEKYQMSEEDIAIIQQETQGIVTKRVLMEKINNWLGNSKMLIVGGLAVLLGYKIYQNYIKK